MSHLKTYLRMCSPYACHISEVTLKNFRIKSQITVYIKKEDITGIIPEIYILAVFGGALRQRDAERLKGFAASIVALVRQFFILGAPVRAPGAAGARVRIRMA